jgi:NAD(P)-dependent dehydrogenase (short-subunit alcohol dehydrogenase family)
VLVIDVTEAASIADAAARVEDLDVLINNAGVMIDGNADPPARSSLGTAPSRHGDGGLPCARPPAAGRHARATAGGVAP